MKWLILLVVAVAGVRTSGVELTFPELARGSQSRIVSGWEATDGQIPHQLSLRMVSNLGQVFACGASIIHPEWALTAAHCTAQRVSLVIRVGTRNLTTPHQIFESTEYYNHPLYNEAIAGIVQPNDIGVIKFPIAIEYNDLVKPIRIQRSGDKDKNYSGLQLTASGWGALWTQSASPENLNWVYLLGTTNDVCRVAYGNSPIIQPSTICASGYNDTTQSTCQGDSGGPLSIVDEDGQLTLVGVTSFVSGMGCHVDLPAGFVRPGYYHEWITEVTGVNFDWEFVTSSTVVPTTTSTAEPTTTSTAEPTTTSSAEPTTTSIAEPTTTEAAATEEPATEVPATEEPATEEPATEEPATEEPATEEPATEEPATEEPATEEPATEEPATEEPATEEPATEEPATEEPATEEPATEEPATEEPATEAAY